jgi:endonuclease/exonuclease/phosphatase family metal-dependent hydrolase
MTEASAASFTVSSFNTHWGGRDVSGRTEYDLPAACRALDTDVRVFQEVWDHPDELARLWLPDEFERHVLVMRRAPRPDHFELPEPQARRVGDFTLVVATRFPLLERRVIELFRTRKDPRHQALACWLDTPLGPTWVVAVHLTIGLLPLGSARQLRSLVPQIDRDGPAIIVGDHNLWRPPAHLIVGRRWSASVKGKTWPAHRPRHQIDHIWARGLRPTGGRVLYALGGDHLAVTATMMPPDKSLESPQVSEATADL